MSIRPVSGGEGLVRGLVVRAPLFVSWAFFLLGMVVSVAVWATLTQSHMSGVRPLLDSRVRAYTQLLDTRLSSATGALTRVSERWTAMSGSPPELWAADARGILRDMPTFEHLEWVDENMAIQWHTSRTEESWSASDRHRLAAEHLDRLSAARKLEHDIATVLRGSHQTNDTKLDVFVPINEEGRFRGFVRGTIDLHHLMGDAYADLGLISHLRIWRGEDLIYQAGDAPAGDIGSLAASATMSGRDFAIRAELLPNDALFEQQRPWHPIAVAAFTFIVTLLLTLVLRQYGNIITKEDRLAASVSALDTANAQSSYHQAHLESIYSVVPVGVCMLDRNLRFTFVNERLARMFNRAVSDYIGRTPRDMDAGMGERLEPFMQYVLTGDTPLESVEVNELSKTKGGQGRDWVCSFHPVHNSAGSVIGVAAAFLDITSLKEAEKENSDLSKKLFQTQKTEALGRLTGGIAHDFNNMLGVILGSLEFVKERTSSDAELSGLINRIEQAAEHSAELIRQLLAFARRQPLVPRNVDVKAAVDQILPLIRRSIGENIDIHFVPGKDLWIARVDDSQLGSAILNLVINARDAMPEGGNVTIEVANAELDENYTFGETEVVPGEYVMISISDTGTGMTPETVARAFEPFFTTKETGKGSGLGLSMVFGFIKQSQGHIKIYSEVNVGTAVKLYLPRAEDGQTVTSKAEAERVVVGNEKILVVEDDAMMRDVAVRQLKSLGYDVISADGGAEALDILEQNRDIALMITDVVMPGGMNGPELAKTARARHPSLKIMFVSGYTDNALIDRGWLTDGVQLLQKPYRRADLAAKVRTVLRG